MASIPNIKYKTEYCLYWKEGTLCQKGLQCFFAHGQKELRTIEGLCFCIVFLPLSQITQNHQEIMMRQTEKVFQEGKPNNYKTIFCKFYAEGQCKLGDKCTYAHERRERKKKKHSQDYNIDNGHQSNWTQQQINDYYHQIYYYQMYQMSQQPFNYLSQPLPETSTDLPQHAMLNFFSLHQPASVEAHYYEKKDLKPTIGPSELYNQREETPQVKKMKVETPSSGETETATIGTLTQLNVHNYSSEFKTEP